MRRVREHVDRADALDPMECRAYVEDRFAPERMVGDYVAAYVAALSQ